MVGVSLKTSLLKGLAEDERKELRGLFLEALRVRKRLIQVLEEKRQSVQMERLGKEDYNSSSWAFKQAEMNGYERGINELISLLKDAE
jgi:hypothetical protein